MDEKEILIREYITEEECSCMCDGDSMFDCTSCSCLEECYMNAYEKCDVEFAKSVNYGGYNNEEDFWEQIY